MFKISTTAAAIEEKDDLDQFRYTCTGSLEVGGDVITCPYAPPGGHGHQPVPGLLLQRGLRHLAMELGGSTLAKYVEQAGLLTPLNVNHLHRFRQLVAEEDGAYLGWSGGSRTRTW